MSKPRPINQLIGKQISKRRLITEIRAVINDKTVGWATNATFRFKEILNLLRRAEGTVVCPLCGGLGERLEYTRDEADRVIHTRVVCKCEPSQNSEEVAEEAVDPSREI